MFVDFLFLVQYFHTQPVKSIGIMLASNFKFSIHVAIRIDASLSGPGGGSRPIHTGVYCVQKDWIGWKKKVIVPQRVAWEITCDGFPYFCQLLL